MKKRYLMWVVLLLLLSGCSAPEDFETMADEYMMPQEIPAQQTNMLLDREAVDLVGHKC